jgi:Fe-S cluster assembly protein SufD
MANAFTTYDDYRADFKAFQEGLPIGELEWLRGMREHAMSNFNRSGFPTTRRGNEEWKYTNVVPLANAKFKYSPDVRLSRVTSEDVLRHSPHGAGWVTLAFVNGRYDPALSTMGVSGNGVCVTNLADALVTSPNEVARHLSKYAVVEGDGFTALNTAFLRDGAFVHIPDGDKFATPVHLLYLSTDSSEPMVSYPRTLVVLGQNAKLDLVESYVGLATSSYFTNAVTELVVGPGAELSHYRVLVESPDAFHIGTTRVSQERDSTFSSMAFSMGAAIARNDFSVVLGAPGSMCNLSGLYMTTDNRKHVDYHIDIDHVEPHTTSRQYHKGILAGRSVAVYAGRVLVRKGAQKSDARQADKNLILSRNAEVNTKPSMEIYADDVKCTHGATAGQIAGAEDSLFYMRSRGLDWDTANGLLIRAFASEIVDTIQLKPIHDYLDQLIAGVLPSLHLGEAR